MNLPHTHREHTHTDQYLNFDGHHHLGHKKSVVKTIFCCFNTVISKEEDRMQEIEHLKSILHDSNYKAWLWKILEKEREKQRAASTKQNSNASQVSLSPTYKVRAFHKQGVNTNHVLWKATILSYWGNIYSTIKIQQEVPLMSKWHIFYCDLGQSFLLLETFITSNHEIANEWVEIPGSHFLHCLWSAKNAWLCQLHSGNANKNIDHST